MNLDLTMQNFDHTLPPMPAKAWTGSALPVTLTGIDPSQGDGTVEAVSVEIVNADGVPFRAPCVASGEAWQTAFVAACFARYGFVRRGLRVDVTFRRGDGSSVVTTFAIANLIIESASPDAEPGGGGGGGSTACVRKGDDVYLKSTVVDGVQHYIRQQMVYSEEMAAWGAEWVGDYVLEGGEFVEVS